jgi:3-phenylpropionate/trans-cinnamate dioxygenase ferredoxin reductase subunit
MSKTTQLAVIGASVATGALVSQLRSDGFQGRVVVVDFDADAPYDRPPLSKEFLAGDSPRPEAPWWDDGCELIRGRAVSLDPRNGVVAVEVPGVSQIEIRADHVVIATGAAPVVLPGEPAGVAHLRSAEDARRIREHAVPGRNVVILGAGTIGTELASSLNSAGCRVTLLDQADRPLDRFLGGHLANESANWIEEAGVALCLSTKVDGITAFGGGWIVSTGPREHVADLVVSAVGTRPATAWLEDSGLDVSNGLRCDADGTVLDTDGLPVPNVHAIGDVATWDWNGTPRRFEDWTTAQRQGRHVARNILGLSTGRLSDERAYFWSNQFGRRVQVLGVPERDGKLIQHVYVPERRAAFYTVERGSETVAWIAVNCPKEFAGAMRSSLQISA